MRRQPLTLPLRGLLLVATIALLVAAATFAAAQQPEAVVTGETVVTEVLLDVVVTDRRGSVVVGLDEDDFVVQENGEPVELNDVTFYSHRRFLDTTDVAEQAGIDPAAVPVDRYFILFFHDQRLALPRLTARQLDAARRARQWVDSDLQTNDWVAVVAFDTSLEVLQDFTNVEEHLDDAINRAAQGREALTETASRQPAGAPSLLPHLEGEAVRIYDALEMIASATEHVRGRKNLALFSIGFGDVDEVGLYTPDPRYYPQMVRALNDANVAVYAIDLIPGSDGSVLDAFGNALSNLSADTGGEYYFNFVNFLTPLERMASDTNGYYLLSYSAAHPGERGYQRVEVDTVDPALEVRAREGYLLDAPAMAGATGR